MTFGLLVTWPPPPAPYQHHQLSSRFCVYASEDFWVGWNHVTHPLSPSDAAIPLPLLERQEYRPARRRSPPPPPLPPPAPHRLLFNHVHTRIRQKTSYRNKKIDAQKSGCNFMRQINSKRWWEQHNGSVSVHPDPTLDLPFRHRMNCFPWPSFMFAFGNRDSWNVFRCWRLVLIG